MYSLPSEMLPPTFFKIQVEEMLWMFLAFTTSYLSQDVWGIMILSSHEENPLTSLMPSKALLSLSICRLFKPELTLHSSCQNYTATGREE